jgi:uncharacterized membrane protein YgcG
MRWLCAILCLCLLGSQAAAEERIKLFQSDVAVGGDASVSVTELITVNVEGNDIRHGIYRDFPTRYEGRNGRPFTVGFSVKTVTLDGKGEDYKVESITNGKRIKIGSADRIVAEGLHTYAITYATSRQIGFFDGYDELYWNVTGNFWKFPIDKSVVTVRLPSAAVIKRHAEYTGAIGATERNASGQANVNIYHAETTVPLDREEGFTVALAWQKGVVTPPGEIQSGLWLLLDYAWAVMAALTLLLTGLYFLFAWMRVGRDPPKGVVVPLFHPPPALDPAGVRYIWTRAFDNKGFAAALVGLAVKGRLKIAETDSSFEITRLADRAPEPLTNAERALFEAMPSDTTELDDANHVAVGKMRQSLARRLKAEFEGAAFLRNLGWFWGGAILSITGLVLAAFMLPGDEGMLALFLAVFLAVWWGVILTILWGAVTGLFSQPGLMGKAKSIFVVLFLLPFVGAGIGVPVLFSFFNETSPELIWFGAAAVVTALLNVLFYHLMSAPTLVGRKLLDQIEGFRMYMKTAEEERLNILNPPEKTPRLFERYLPYALALDCENEWNAKFAGVLAAAAATAPVWYSGSNWNTSDMGGFTDSLGSSLASSAGAAASPPGSSSGSGGGGSSGGGGGGGGGGGW